MNFKSTFALLVLAGGVGVLVWKASDVAPKIGLAPEPITATAGSSATVLAGFNASDISAISVTAPGSTVVELKGQNGSLELPGNWPVRRNEVEELVAALTGLKSRFQPVPLESEEALKDFGLAANQSPTVVTIAAKSGNHRLTFGEPTAVGSENPFTRPAYVRVNQEMEVLRLGPDVLPILKRPADYYRKRQLFPDADRVKVADSVRAIPEAAPTFILGDAIRSISVEGPNGRYTLARIAATPKPQPPADKPSGDLAIVAPRLADVWQIVEPIQDRAEPVKLKGVLAAVPDLWVEQFLVNPDPVIALSMAMPAGIGDSTLATLARTATASVVANDLQKEGPFLDRAGLRTNPMRLTLTLTDGAKRSLIIGKTTRVNTKVEPPTPPMAPGQPPPPPKITEEKFYFAKLADNPLIFEVKGDRINDLFFDSKPPMDGPKAEPLGRAIDQLRDPNALRFDLESVVDVRVSRAGNVLELKKTKKDLKGLTEETRKDRWDFVAPFTGMAEPKQVTDLLEPLEKLSAKRGEIIDRSLLHLLTGSLGSADLGALGLTETTATKIELTSDAESRVPPRTLLVGKHDPAKKKLAVMVAGQQRISVVDDTAFAVIDRQPRAYRALKLFDLGLQRVASIDVQKEKETFRLEENVGVSGTTFQLTQPVKTDADTEKAKGLLRDLANLEATEFVFDPPTANELTAIKTWLGPLGDTAIQATTAAYGLDKPSATITLEFAGPMTLPPRKLLLGKVREGKGDFYARLDGAPSVFAIKKEVADIIVAGSLGLRPLQLWNGDVSGLSVIELRRGSDSDYALKQTDGTWKIAVPFEAATELGAVQPLATALAAVKAERFAAHMATNLAEYGLDKPAMRIKFTLTERKVNKPGEEPKEETKQRVLFVGKAEEGKPSRFAMLEGEPAVFVIPETTFKEWDKPALDLLSKKLLIIFPPAVTKLETNGPDGTLALQKEGNEWKPVGANFPVDRPTVDNLLRNLSNLNALKFADYGEAIDWAKYGLDANAKPLTVTISLGTETHKLVVGGIVPGTPNDRYARVDDGKAVAVLAVTIARDLARGKLDFVERTIFKFDPIDLQAIRRSMAGQELELSLEGTNWSVLKPSKFPADQAGVEDLSEKLGVLRAERVADIEGKDLAKFGLDKPAAVLKLELIGKGAKPIEKALKIGGPLDPMKPEGERFVQLDGASTVVVLGAPIAKRLLAAPIKFRDRSLASFVTADKIVITRDAQDMTFLKAGTWKMMVPVAADAEDEALRDVHDLLARLRGEEIVAEKPSDLKPYGLDKPERWRLFNGDKEVLNLLIGAREKIAGKEGGRVFAKLDKGDLVVLLDMPLTAKVTAEYRKRTLWEPLDVAQASKIEFDTLEGPGSFKLTKGPLGWMDVANPVERLNGAAVTEFLDAFAGLKADRFVEHDAKDGVKIYGLEPPRKTITVSTQNGQKRTLLLGRLDDAKQVYAKTQELGPKTVLRLSESDTAKINRERSGFAIPGEKKEPPKKEPEPKKVEPKAEPKKVEPKKEPEPKKVEPKKEPEPKVESKKVEPKKEPELKKVEPKKKD